MLFKMKNPYYKIIGYHSICVSDADIKDGSITSLREQVRKINIRPCNNSRAQITGNMIFAYREPILINIEDYPSRLFYELLEIPSKCRAAAIKLQSDSLASSYKGYDGYIYGGQTMGNLRAGNYTIGASGYSNNLINNIIYVR